MYTYPWYHWITFFYIYCFFGWIFESTYVSLKKRRFVNRGFLRLPMLPLYGSGAVMMLWVSLPLKDNLVAVYFAGVVAATILEYITGYTMERLFKMKYWDYSNQRFHLNGYICLSSSIAWGFLTILMTEVIHTPIANMVMTLSPYVEFPLLAIISALFIADVIQSTKAALDLGRALEAMTKMKVELEEMQVQLSLLKAETTQKVYDLKEDAAMRVADLKEDAVIRMAELKEGAAVRAGQCQEVAVSRAGKIQEEAASRAIGAAETAMQKATEWKQKEDMLSSRILSLTEKRQKLSHLSFYPKALLRGNPTASSGKFAEALKELRGHLE